jgi:orotidine-5'-phosphate decarboxylase
MEQNSRILLPLDFPTIDQAVSCVAQLRDDVAGFKVGLELINAVGFEIFDRIRQTAGPAVRIFYDCKLHDIPNTVAGASKAIARRGVWMFNVHASGGSSMMKAAVEAAAQGAAEAGVAKPLVIAVTVLTSISAEALANELAVGRTVAGHVAALARMAQDAGCDGVVASPHEIGAIREACGRDFSLVIPGVRPAGSAIGDQKRVMTPGEAASAGADYLVIGRPITGAADPVAATRAINREVAGNNG